MEILFFIDAYEKKGFLHLKAFYSIKNKLEYVRRSQKKKNGPSTLKRDKKECTRFSE